MWSGGNSLDLLSVDGRAVVVGAVPPCRPSGILSCVQRPGVLAIAERGFLLLVGWGALWAPLRERMTLPDNIL